MPIDLPLNSRYLSTDPVKFNGEETIGWWTGPDWLDSEASQTIVATASQEGRLDNIASEFLGSPDLWWTLLYYNKKTDINWPRAGDEVAIPNTGLVLGT